MDTNSDTNRFDAATPSRA